MQPRTLDDLARWAAVEGAASLKAPPIALHRRSGDDEACGCGQCRDQESAPGDAIHGLPFARAFVSYIDGSHRAMTPIRRALNKMRSRRDQSVEFQICYAIVEGGQPVDHVQTILRCGTPLMRRALATLHELTEVETALSKPEIAVS